MLIHSFKQSFTNFVERDVQSFSRASLQKIEGINLKVAAFVITVFAVLVYLFYQLNQWEKRAVKAEEESTELKKKIDQMGEKLKPQTPEDATLNKEQPPLETADTTQQEGLQHSQEADTEKNSEADLTANQPEAPETIVEQHAPAIEEQVPVQEPKIVEEDPLTTVPSTINTVQFFNVLKEKTLELPVLPTLPYSMACLSEKYLCQVQNHVVIEGETDTHYLHAHHLHLMGRHFIAAQYPKLGFEFLKACQGSSLVVNLEDFSPNLPVNVIDKLIDRYTMFKQGSTYQISSKITPEDFLTVYCVESQKVVGLNASRCEHKISSSKFPEFNINHLQYHSWQDNHRLPIADLDKLVNMINESHDDPKKPVVVHCSYGHGKTAIVILASVMRPLIKKETITPGNLQEELTKLILEARKQYGPDFLNSSEQLKTLCDWCQWHFKIIAENKSFDSGF